MKRSLLFLCILGSLSLVTFSTPTKVDNFGTFSLNFENDSFVRTDREYTGGVKLGWISKDLKNYRTNPWLKWLPFVKDPEYHHELSLSFGQNVYTPDDITREDLLVEDRPYAGFLFLTVGIHSVGDRVMDTWDFTIGIIGLHSYAEQVQKWIHKIFDGDEPRGWKHQLKSELGIGIIYERNWKWHHSKHPEGFGLDIIPHIGGGLGNISIYASTGVQMRFGWNLPEDFGASLSRPGGDRHVGYRQGERLGVEIFAGIDGKAVLRDIFLDGNSIRDSHWVEKNHFIADFYIGIGMGFGPFNVSYNQIFWTKRYKTETKAHTFGAVSVSYSY